MKHLLYLLLVLASLSCKAQTPIVNIDASRSGTVDGAYFKDLNNEFNKFVGTWVFTDGTTTFTIELKKVEMIYNGNDYEDKIVGEYKFESNGLTYVNTLPNINNSNPAKHSITGRTLINSQESINCDDCGINEKRLELYFDDPERLYLSNSVILRYLNYMTNPEKITVTIYATSGGVLPYEEAPEVIRVPYGTYLMEKQ